MPPETPDMLPLLAVNLAFAVVALAIGFVAGAWFLGGRRAVAAKPAGQEPTDTRLDKQVAIERAMMASDRLRDLASGVASNVGEHSSRIEAINQGLVAARNSDEATRGGVMAQALSDIVSANEQLQQQLAKAERQIQSQAQEIRTFESEARTDSLTQLNNRRAFDDELARRYAEWTRKQTPVSLLLLDVDHFKKFNDTHGHQAGDEVLRSVAKTLRASTREMDLACRYGGEEFAVILPATHARDLAALVDRIRTSIAETKVVFEGKKLSVTASFGLAEVAAGDEVNTLLKRADEALYASKDAGRNCAHLNEQGANLLFTPGAAMAAPPEVVDTPNLDALPNRTKFAEELRRRIAEAKRTAADIGVIAFEVRDIEQMKRQLGESVAVTALDAVAQFLASTMREMDLLARLEEARFVLMLPGSGAETTDMVAERMSATLAGCRFPAGGREVSMSVATGAASIQGDDTAASVIRRAEGALAKDLQPAPV
ncbi:Response regulator PleD [Pirellulimonas nuda]|uniref:diguanylate cyclase n=1 Tax=Pirellulimonas nuda TaxID=2528009 RepID=A0A518D7U7_9BACT|nr:diguanylate cyclase [Pirellulimonas nuda]QDU87547.1 Response regulator PleD [Pirellulimonas nuda]